MILDCGYYSTICMTCPFWPTEVNEARARKRPTQESFNCTVLLIHRNAHLSIQHTEYCSTSGISIISTIIFTVQYRSVYRLRRMYLKLDS